MPTATIMDAQRQRLNPHGGAVPVCERHGPVDAAQVQARSTRGPCHAPFGRSCGGAVTWARPGDTATWGDA